MAGFLACQYGRAQVRTTGCYLKNRVLTDFLSQVRLIHPCFTIRGSSVFSRVQGVKEKNKRFEICVNKNSMLFGTVAMKKIWNYRFFKFKETLLNESLLNLFESGIFQCIRHLKQGYDKISCFRNQPLILVYSERERKKITLIPELCSITGNAQGLSIMNRSILLDVFERSVELIEKLANN